MIASFWKCGIFQLDVTKLLGRLRVNQSTQRDDAVAADSSLIEILTRLHGGGPKCVNKFKRIAVVPCKSVSVGDIAKEDPPDVSHLPYKVFEFSKQSSTRGSVSKRNCQFPSDTVSGEDNKVLLDFVVGCQVVLSRRHTMLSSHWYGAVS